MKSGKIASEKHLLSRVQVISHSSKINCVACILYLV